MKYVKIYRNNTGNRENGGVLIGLIIIILIFAVLGTVLMQLFPMAISTHLSSSQSLRAYYNAESGYRYAASKYLHGASGQDRDKVLLLYDATNNPLGINDLKFDLLNNQGSFIPSFEGFFYEFAGISGGTVTATAYGIIPTGLSGTSGKLLFYDDPDHIVGSYTGVTRNDNSNITFTGVSINGSADVSSSTRLFVGATALSTTGDTLTIDTTNYNGYELFPEKYGNFRVFNDNGEALYGGEMFRYKTKNTATLQDIVNITGDEVLDANVNGKNIMLQRFIRMTSVGQFGSSTSPATRRLVYNVPIEADPGGIKLDTTEDIYDDINWDNFIDDNPYVSSTSLGDWIKDTPGGDDALTVDKTTDSKKIEAAIGYGEYSPNPFEDAWSRSGGFLSYDLQIKVGTGTWEGGSDGHFVNKPEYYSAGPAFRVKEVSTGTLRYYSIHFLKSTYNSVPEDDGIPYAMVPGAGSNINQYEPEENVNNEPIVLLWYREGENAADYKWLAYSTLGSGSNVLDMDQEEVCEDLNGDGDTDDEGECNPIPVYKHLKDWSTIYVRVVEAASIKLNKTLSDPSNFNAGDTVVSEHGSAMVVKKIHDPVDDREVLLLNNVIGTFEPTDSIGGIALNQAYGYRSKDNYIWAFIGDEDPHPDASANPLDNERLGNPRSGEINWVVDKIGNWSANNDYFTLLEWEGIRPTDDADPDRQLFNDFDYDNVVVRTSRYVSQPEGTTDYDINAEVGLNTFGNFAVDTYFDDLAFYLKGPQYSGGGEVGFLDAVVQE